MTHNTSLQPPAIKGWFESSGRLYQQRIRDLSLLRRLGDAINCDMELAEASDNILDILVDELDITNASIMLLAPDGTSLVLQSTREQEPGCALDEQELTSDKASISIRVGEGIGSTVMETRQPILIQDAQSDARLVQQTNQSSRMGSLLCLPLIVRDKPVGVLNLSHTHKSAFSQGDLHGLP